MKRITQEWLNRAKDDLDAANQILTLPHLTNIVAFHSQQAIEKTLKAVLEEHSEHVPRIHSLVRLYSLVKSRIDIVVDELTLKEISDTYLDSRYPGELGILPYGKPTLSDAESFYQTAKTIYDNVYEHLMI